MQKLVAFALLAVYPIAMRTKTAAVTFSFGYTT